MFYIIFLLIFFPPCPTKAGVAWIKSPVWCNSKLKKKKKAAYLRNKVWAWCLWRPFSFLHMGTSLWLCGVWTLGQVEPVESTASEYFVSGRSLCLLGGHYSTMSLGGWLFSGPHLTLLRWLYLQLNNISLSLPANFLPISIRLIKKTFLFY